MQTLLSYPKLNRVLEYSNTLQGRAPISPNLIICTTAKTDPHHQQPNEVVVVVVVVLLLHGH